MSAILLGKSRVFHACEGNVSMAGARRGRPLACAAGALEASPARRGKPNPSLPTLSGRRWWAMQPGETLTCFHSQSTRSAW